MNESATFPQLLNLWALWLVIPGVILVVRGIPWLYRREIEAQQPSGGRLLVALRMILLLGMLAALLHLHQYDLHLPGADEHL